MEAATHKCYIQVAKSPLEEKEKTAGLSTLEANGEGMGLKEEEDKPPLLVFFNIEAMQDTGCNVPNLLIAETEQDDCPEHFKGEDCVKHFLEWMDTLTENDTSP